MISSFQLTSLTNGWMLWALSYTSWNWLELNQQLSAYTSDKWLNAAHVMLRQCGLCQEAWSNLTIYLCNQIYKQPVDQGYLLLAGNAPYSVFGETSICVCTGTCIQSRAASFPFWTTMLWAILSTSSVLRLTGVQLESVFNAKLGSSCTTRAMAPAVSSNTVNGAAAALLAWQSNSANNLWVSPGL